jgi:hypothetical protein
MSDPYADRKNLSFEQAEGVEPLPRQLRLKEISQQLRALFWKVVYDDITRYHDVVLNTGWCRILNSKTINCVELKKLFSYGGVMIRPH